MSGFHAQCGFSEMCVCIGPTAYVLTRSPGEGGGGGGGGGGARGGEGVWLWNASTGRHTTQCDPHCPLTSVHCVIGKQNVSVTSTQHMHHMYM